MLQRYGTVNKAGDKIQRKYVKKALPEGGFLVDSSMPHRTYR